MDENDTFASAPAGAGPGGSAIAPLGDPGVVFTRRCDMQAGQLDVTCRDTDGADLFDFAERNNPRRAFLFVSRVLGRHIPVAPSAMRAAFTALADTIRADLPGPMVMTGMAETALGLGAGVHDAYLARTGRRDVVYLCTTRARLGGDLLATFREEHSHASDHLVHVPQHATDAAMLRNARSLVMVDDEASSGDTFRNLAAGLIGRDPGAGDDIRDPGGANDNHDRDVAEDVRDAGIPENAREAAVVAALSHPSGPQNAESGLANAIGPVLDSLPAAPLRDIRHIHTAVLTDWSGAAGNRVAADRPDIVVTRGALLHGSFCWTGAPGAPVRRLPDADVLRQGKAQPIRRDDDGRLGRSVRTHAALPAGLAASIGKTPLRVLVLGTGEHVWEPFMLAELLEKAGHDVRFGSTTRSPILPGLAVRRGYTFGDHEGLGIANYLYNVDPAAFDRVLLCVDTALTAIDPGLVAALGCDVLVGDAFHPHDALPATIRGAPPARLFRAGEAP